MHEVSFTNEVDLARWGHPWRLRVVDLFEMRFQTPQEAYKAFFGKVPHVVLSEPLAALVRAALAEHGGTVIPDPRARSVEELGELPTGTVLSYYGQGEVYRATKQASGRWLSDFGSYVVPTMQTVLQK